MTYGSGQYQIDECKAEAGRHAIEHYTALAHKYAEGSVEREAIEARIGREAVRLREVEERLMRFRIGLAGR